MNLERRLLEPPPSAWKTEQAIVFDWYDGPREGFCRLSYPEAEFRFRLVDERSTPDGLDERLLRVDELPAGSVERTLAVLAELGAPAAPVWVPMWRFASPENKQRAEAALRAIEEEARPTHVVFLTQDLQEFLGCWSVDVDANGADWFSMLGIPKRQPA
ncbi:MAG: hypothetical protein U0797_01960 [Gemmataceae bacterium]